MFNVTDYRTVQDIVEPLGRQRVGRPMYPLDIAKDHTFEGLADGRPVRVITRHLMGRLDEGESSSVCHHLVTVIVGDSRDARSVADSASAQCRVGYLDCTPGHPKTDGVVRRFVADLLGECGVDRDDVQPLLDLPKAQGILLGQDNAAGESVYSTLDAAGNIRIRMVTEEDGDAGTFRVAQVKGTVDMPVTEPELVATTKELRDRLDAAVTAESPDEQESGE